MSRSEGGKPNLTLRGGDNAPSREMPVDNKHLLLEMISKSHSDWKYVMSDAYVEAIRWALSTIESQSVGIAEQAEKIRLLREALRRIADMREDIARAALEATTTTAIRAKKDPM